MKISQIGLFGVGNALAGFQIHVGTRHGVNKAHSQIRYHVSNFFVKKFESERLVIKFLYVSCKVAAGTTELVPQEHVY